MTNYVVRFFGAWGEQSQWPPLTEIMNLKKSQLFIEYPFRLNNLKFVAQKIFFFLTLNIHCAYRGALPPQPSYQGI